MGKFKRKQVSRLKRNRTRFHEVTMKFVIPTKPGERAEEEAQVHRDALGHSLARYYGTDEFEITGFDVVQMPKEYIPPYARSSDDGDE